MAFGRLDRSKSPEPMSQINMTPLVDVMLVLVVIFIITAPLLASSIHVKLPTTEVAQANEAPSAVLVVVDEKGKLYWKDNVVEVDQLLTHLTQSAAQNPQTEVQLRADHRVPYGDIVKVMSISHKAGLTRIGFASEPPARP